MKLLTIVSITVLVLLVLLPINGYPWVPLPVQTVDDHLIEDTNGLVLALCSTADRAEAFALLRRHRTLITRTVCDVISAEAESAGKARSPNRAVLLYEIAIDAAAESNNSLSFVQIMNQLAVYYSENGNFQSAIEVTRRVKQVAEETKSYPYLIIAQINLGQFHYSFGKHEQARNYSLELLADAQPFADSKSYGPSARKGIVAAWALLGKIAADEGNYQESLGYLHKSLKLSIEMSNKWEIAERLTEIGIVHQAAGDHTEALRLYTQALEVAQREAKAPALVQRVQNSIGVLYLDQGDYATASKYLEASLAIAQDAGNERITASVLINIGVTHLRQGDHTGALRKFEEAARNAGDTPAPYLAIPLYEEDLAATYEAQGRYSLALEFFDKALSVAEQSDNKARQAEILWWKGDLLYVQGQYENALRLSEKALMLSNKLNLPNIVRLALTLKGKTLLAQKQYDAAADTLSYAIKTIEQMRERTAGQEQQRALFFEGKMVAYHKMIETLNKQQKQFEALRYAERAKARVLLDTIQSGRPSRDDVMFSSQEREEERKLRSELISINKQISRENQQEKPDKSRLAELDDKLQKARLMYESFQNGFYTAHSELQVPQRQQPFTMEQANSLLSGDKMVVLEYVVTNDITYLFAVTNGPKGQGTKIEVYSIPIKEADLAKETEAFRNSLGSFDLAVRESSRKLYDLLLGPAEQSLLNKNTICVVPDGPLWEIPFQALEKSGHYVIEDHTVFYVPSLMVFAEMSRKARGGYTIRPTLLAFGNPSFSAESQALVRSTRGGGRLVPLPEAEHEVRTLSNLYGQTNSRIYIGPDATEKRFKTEASSYNILHLATHGTVDDLNPLYSYVALAQEGEPDEDGLLEAWEIMRLDLKADIAVLSACDTARGAIRKGEGVIGLSWAFFVAGCPTTVVSQWKVDSSGTAELMVKFHENLVNAEHSQMRKAAALRQAALVLMRNPKYKAPYYWAGFVLVGDPGW